MADRETTALPLLAFGIFFCVCFVAQGQISDQPTSCSERNRNQNMRRCLNAVGEVALNDTHFWFGYDYFTRCPRGSLDSLECYNPNPRIAFSLVSKMFTPGTFNSSHIDRYLEVMYRSPPGQYSGCGNTYTHDKATGFTVDPTSSRVYQPWHLRDMPVVNWNADQGVFYTLLIVDVGFGFIHGLFVNIRASLEDAETVLDYKGPLNFRSVPNPYAFLLFEQVGQLSIDTNWRAIVENQENYSGFNVSQFKVSHNLRGPVAMNWVRASTDPYAVQKMADNGIVNNCPYFITQALRNQNLRFVPANVRLNVNLEMSFSQESMDFSSCCASYSYSPNTVKLNPLANGEIKAADARNDAQPNVQLIMNTLFPNKTRDFAGKLHTLMMVDIDVPMPELGTEERPMNHWMIVNIPDGVLERGTTVYDYMGPLPPDDKPHRYYYLLFEEHRAVDINRVKSYAGDKCMEMVKERCLFDIRSLSRDYNLNLVGATWMITGIDEYVRSVYVQNGQTEEQFCTGVVGYQKGCVNVAAVRSGVPPKMTSITIMAIIISLFTSCANIWL